MFRASLLASLFLLPSLAHADEALPVGLVNVARVFKACRSFEQKMADIKLRIDEVSQNVKAKQAEMAMLKDLIAKTDLNDQEVLRTLQEKLAKLNVEVQTDAVKHKERFLAEEAQIYAKTFDVIREEIAKISKARGLKLVMRSSSGDKEFNTREDILQRVNRAIVYEDGLDITDEVIMAVNKRDEAGSESKK